MATNQDTNVTSQLPLDQMGGAMAKPKVRDFMPEYQNMGEGMGMGQDLGEGLKGMQSGIQQPLQSVSGGMEKPLEGVTSGISKGMDTISKGLGQDKPSEGQDDPMGTTLGAFKSGLQELMNQAKAKLEPEKLSQGLKVKEALALEQGQSQSIGLGQTQKKSHKRSIGM